MLKKYTKIVEAKMKSFVNNKVAGVLAMLKEATDIDTEYFAVLSGQPRLLFSIITMSLLERNDEGKIA